MMESSNLNLDHLHHQEDLHGSSLAVPWNQDLILLNNSEFSNGALSSSRDHFMRATHENMPMVQDLGFQWGPAGHGENYIMNQASSSSHQDLGFHISKNIKDYSLMMPSHVKHEFNQIHGVHPSVNIEELSFEPMNLGNSIGRGSFSMVLPTANISGPGLTQPLYPGSLGMDLQALDLLASARFGKAMSSQPSLNSMALLREDLGYGGCQLQEQAQTPVSTSHRKASLSASGVTELKRSSCLDSRTSEPVTAAKKPRFESRSSFTPFKVRKEKLGDRIAALQQLVAPFGKTDTASVLMEAIGYIKFLQDQVETLSVPYLRPSNNKKTRTSQGESSEERDEAKPDLRSRGLCLVPLPCTSYVTNENGGVWSPPNYRGGT